MPSYTVTFVINDIEAESPLVAAQEVAELLAGDDPYGDERYAYRAVYNVTEQPRFTGVDVDLSKTE
jgi:hypothetical protein